MQALGNKLFACTSFADNQNRTIERRSAAGALNRIEKGE